MATARPASDSPLAGWAHPGAPNGRIFGWDLTQLDEDRLLRDGRATLYGLARAPDGYSPTAPPLILVHGLDGAPRDLQTVVDRLWSAPYQIYVLCYDDFHRRASDNGDDFAGELRALAAFDESARAVTVIAHSMGGIVSRRALNRLSTDGAGPLFQSLRLIGADNPWHGYPGPSDRGIEGLFFNMIRPVFPGGLEDLRAASNLFRGDPGAPDPAARTPLNQAVLPDHFSIDVFFAQQGNEVLDYTEGVLSTLPDLLVEHYKEGTSIEHGKLDDRIVNYWNALLAASAFVAFEEAISDAADAGRLDRAAALALLEQHYPRFPGNHVGILQEQPGASFLDYLSAQLAAG